MEATKKENRKRDWIPENLGGGVPMTRRRTRLEVKEEELGLKVRERRQAAEEEQVENL